MSENKNLTQEEVAALLIKRTRENAQPTRALPDDELDSVAGGMGSYVISDVNGECVTAHCSHPETTNSDLRSSLLSGTACAYGKAEGVTTCNDCLYLLTTIAVGPVTIGSVTVR